MEVGENKMDVEKVSPTSLIRHMEERNTLDLMVYLALCDFKKDYFSLWDRKAMELGIKPRVRVPTLVACHLQTLLWLMLHHVIRALLSLIPNALDGFEQERTCL